jgi:hypothetical protein
VHSPHPSRCVVLQNRKNKLQQDSLPFICLANQDLVLLLDIRILGTNGRALLASQSASNSAKLIGKHLF